MLFWRLFVKGDSGYPRQPFLMTPTANPCTEAERYYNRVHSRTQSKMESCIGLLKTRFRCLLGERKLRYSHFSASNIIYTFGILHNMLITVDDTPLPQREIPNIPNHRHYLNEGKTIRNNLANFVFNSHDIDFGSFSRLSRRWLQVF